MKIAHKKSQIIQKKYFENLSLTSFCYKMAACVLLLKQISYLHKVTYGDKFIHVIKVAYSNTQSKIKINSLLSDLLTVMWVRQVFLLSILLCNIAADVLANFINATEKIKGIQIGENGIKIVNFEDNTNIFLRDVNCLNRIQAILKLCVNAKIT